MVIGLALISWDETLGSIIDFKYPYHLEISNDLINNLLMSHSIDKNATEELIEIEFNEQIILSYCDKSRIDTQIIELLILIIHEKERVKIDDLKSKLINLAQSVLKQPKELRNDYISINIQDFFKKTLGKKVLILGRAGTGKTSIKKVMFEGKDPKDLLYNPLEPTRGLSPSIYSWLDLNLGFFDTSGQELNILLEDMKERSLAFANSSIVIYVFDYPSWNYQNQEIIDEIEKIIKIMKEITPNAQLILFLHKVDLIRKYSKKFEIELPKIRTFIKNEFNLPIYFTSIHPEIIFNMYNAFCEILGMISPESSYLKDLLDNKIKKYSNTMGFITNNNHSVVAESISEDFDFNLINHVHKLVAQLNQSFSDMVENDDINYLLMSSYKGLTIIMKHLNIPEYNISKIICVSQSLSNEEIVELASQFGIIIEKIQIAF